MNNKEEMAKKIYSKKKVEQTIVKIKQLGISNTYDVYTFLNLQLFTSIIFFFMVLYIFKLGYFIAPILTFLYYYLFEKIFLDYKIKKRITKLEEEAVYFFEVLTLSLETGKNLEEALVVTLNNVESELSLEFSKAIREVKYGKSLTESLTDMQSYIPCDNINNIILTLTQANIFGNSVLETLYNQVDYIREKRKLELKAEISKLPIKISILSVLFFIPLILLIILAPVLLTYIK